MSIVEKEKREVKLILASNSSDRRCVTGFLEKFAFYGSLLLILLTAIPYGTVDPWYKSFFVFAVCIFVSLRICFGILTNTLLFRDLGLLAPLLGILLLAIIQVIPFSGKTISFDIYETKKFILTFAGIILIGEVLLYFTRSGRHLRFLVYLVLVVGIGSALFGILRHFFFPGIFSSYLDEQVQFAQFVNRNHFALLMEMTLGLLIGLFLRANLPRWSQPFFWIAIAVVCFAVIATNSRGGIISATGLALLAVFVHFLTKKKDYETIGNNHFVSRKKRRLKIFLPAAAITFLFFIIAIFTIAFVGGDAVTSRLESVQTEINAEKSPRVVRLDIWLSTIKLIEDHPVAGVGFGAYARAITLYDTSINRFALEQAHNDYLEVLANGGITAFLLMLVFALLLVQRIKAQFASTNSFRQASCFGAGIGIGGVIFHSIVDFGLHVIVNALIFIVLIVIATARIGDLRESNKN